MPKRCIWGAHSVTLQISLGTSRKFIQKINSFFFPDSRLLIQVSCVLMKGLFTHYESLQDPHLSVTSNLKLFISETFPYLNQIPVLKDWDWTTGAQTAKPYKWSTLSSSFRDTYYNSVKVIFSLNSKDLIILIKVGNDPALLNQQV